MATNHPNTQSESANNENDTVTTSLRLQPAESKVYIPDGSLTETNSSDEVKTLAHFHPNVEQGASTPPLANGQKPLHPLLDEKEIAASASRSADDRPSASSSSKPTQSLGVLDSMATEPGYPSPSGGFVPPVNEESWVLKEAPVAKRALSSANNGKDNSFDHDEQSSSCANERRNSSHQENPSRNNDSLSDHRYDDSEAIHYAASTTIQNSTEQAARQPSSSTSALSFFEGSAHSQAISARSSPSTVAPQRRRSSAMTSNPDRSSTFSQDDAVFDPPLKIRDFAYNELDPRHVGARDVTLADPDDEKLSGSGFTFSGASQDWKVVDEDDEEIDEYDGEDVNSDGAARGLPLGLYHAAYDFEAESEHELGVKVGQRVRLVGHVDGGWAIVVRVKEGEKDIPPDEETVEKGLVPEAYLEWLSS